MAPTCIIPDATWLKLLDEGLTSAEASARTGRSTPACRHHARRLWRRWAQSVADGEARAAPLRKARMDPGFDAKRIAGLRASRRNAVAAAANVRRRFGLDRLSAKELEEYRLLRRKKFSRPEAARMIGRADILIPIEEARAQRAEVETALGEKMRAFLKAEGVHKPKLPPEIRDQDGPRAQRRAAVHQMVLKRPGITARVIADALGCSPDTVENDLAWLRNRRVIVRGERGGHVPVREAIAA